MYRRARVERHHAWIILTWGTLASCVQRAPSGSAEAGVAVAQSSQPAAQTAPAPVPTPNTRPHGDPEIEAFCRDICERTVELKCSHPNECTVNCLAMGTVTPCTQEMTAFYRCLVKQPAKNWECDDDGVAAIRQGFCDKEQEKTLLCMDKTVKR